MTPEKRAALRAIASAATHGPWHVDRSEIEDQVIWGPSGEYIAGVGDAVAVVGVEDPASTADASHIAAFHPPTALRLLDELDAKDAEIERLRALVRRAEWVEGEIQNPGEDWCPWCGALESVGHLPDCAARATLEVSP